MDRADETDDGLTSAADIFVDSFGKFGAMELQALQLSKAWKMAYSAGGLRGLLLGGGLVRLAIQRVNQCAGEAELELKRVGIPIVNRDFDQYNLYFDVKATQANWAEYVLLRAHYVVTSKPVDPRNATWAAGKGRVPAWRDRGRVDRRKSLRGWWGRLLDWIAGG